MTVSASDFLKLGTFGYQGIMIRHSTIKSAFMFQERTAPGERVIVAVKQGNLLGTAFHPELTADTRWYMYLLFAITWFCLRFLKYVYAGIVTF